MKKLFFFLLVLISVTGFSQNFGKTQINGKVIVERADVIGITVYNKTLSLGAITDDKGEFTLDVQLNDVIEVSAVHYKNVRFNVNDDILKSRSMKIFLI